MILYSEALKLQVLRELEAGRYQTCGEARRAYGIRGSGTIQYWAQKYGKEHLLGKVVRVETAKERSELKRLRGRVRELERALADERVSHLLDESYLKIACEVAGIEDVEEFKKKHAGRR